MLKYLAHLDPNNSNLGKTPILNDESKGCDSPYKHHNTQSSDDLMRCVRYFEICSTFEFEISRGLDNKALLEKLVNTISLPKLEGGLINQNTLIPSPCMNAMQYDVYDET